MKLHGGDPFWPVQSGLMSIAPPLEADAACDVLIVGAGITGALVADALVAEGRSVIVLDRRDIASGSTSASTALLQYEIDVPLVELAQLIGAGDARRAYRAGVTAIDDLARIAASASCPVDRVPSLYLARDTADMGFLQRECEARRLAGLDAQMVDSAALREQWGIHAAGAIVSAVGATIDPYRLAHALLDGISTRGAIVRDRTAVTRIVGDERGVEALTDRGAVVRASWLVLACGYEIEAFLPKDIVSRHSTFALVTEPCGKTPPWAQGAIIWEHAQPYLYARALPDGRVMIGGEDEPFTNAAARDALIDAKAKSILTRFDRLMPGLLLERAFAWAGTFGSTADGLGYIGTPPGHPRVLSALGFGGNGITFSAVATRLIPAMIAAGARQPIADPEIAALARLFRFGR